MCKMQAENETLDKCSEFNYDSSVPNALNKKFIRKELLNNYVTSHIYKEEKNESFIADIHDLYKNTKQHCTCSECNGIFDVNNTMEIDNNSKICYKCYENYYSICEICGKIVYKSNLVELSFGEEDISVCDDCDLQLRSILHTRKDIIPLMHFYNKNSNTFVQFQIKINLDSSANLETISSIVKNLNEICSAHEIPLFYITDFEDYSSLNLVSHFLSLEDNFYKNIILQLTMYLSFNTSICSLEALTVRLECPYSEREKYINRLETFFNLLLPYKNIHLDEKLLSNNFEVSTNCVDDIIDKAQLYYVCNKLVIT